MFFILRLVIFIQSLQVDVNVDVRVVSVQSLEDQSSCSYNPPALLPGLVLQQLGKLSEQVRLVNLCLVGKQGKKPDFSAEVIGHVDYSTCLLRLLKFLDLLQTPRGVLLREGVGGVSACVCLWRCYVSVEQTAVVARGAHQCGDIVLGGEKIYFIVLSIANSYYIIF